jgi:hypothetical protein
MKRTVLLLAMWLMAATSYNQSSRTTNNAQKTAPQDGNKTTQSHPEHRTSKDQKSSNSQVNTEHKTNTSTETRKPRTNTTTTTTTTTTTERQHNSNNNTQNRPTHNSNPPDRTQTNRNDSHRQNEYHNTSGNHENNPEHGTSTSRNKNRPVHTAPVTEYYSPRVYREHHTSSHYYFVAPENKRYREVHHIYRPPVHLNVYWTPVMYRRYVEIYPMVRYWNYPVGYQIETISAYDAEYYFGDVMNVYGTVSDVFYSRGTDEYFLYFGPYYPYQDFTAVVPGYIARSYSPRPAIFLENQNIVVTGLITSFEGTPEIAIRDSYQLNVY